MDNISACLICGFSLYHPDNFPADKKDRPAPFSLGNCCSVLKNAIVDLTQRDNKRN